MINFTRCRWQEKNKKGIRRISGARVVLVGDAAVAVVLRESLVAAGVAATCVSEDELGVCLGEGGPDLVVSVLAAADHARLLAVHDACIGRGVGWSALVVGARSTAGWRADSGLFRADYVVVRDDSR